MFQKIRAAWQHRDAGYQVAHGVIELDAGTLGPRETENRSDALVAIEPKARVEAKGLASSRADLAKALVGKETKAQVQQPVGTCLRPEAMVNTDVTWRFSDVARVDIQVVSGN